MTRNTILTVLLIGGLMAADAGAQERERRGRRDRSGRIDRVEQLRRMRLIEELRLDEEEAVRFMSKRAEHEDRMRGLAAERTELLEDLAAAVGSGGDLRAAVSRVLDHDRKLHEERRRHQDDVRKLLSEEKFARLLIFERDFQTELRNAMGRSLRKKSPKHIE